MKKLLFLLFLVSMSCTKLTLECRECHHVLTILKDKDTIAVQMGDTFTACGDTLEFVDGHQLISRMGDHQTAVDIIVCE